MKISAKSGFTLLEILLVVGVLVIIAAVSRDFYGSFVSGAQLDANSKTIIYDIRNTRDKAMNGQDDRRWGVHFVNGSNDYYETFSTPTDYSDGAKVIGVTTYLSNGVKFSYPAEGANTDIIFEKISGLATSSSIIISGGQNLKTISISSQGLIN
jgi:prepilin-type N-terminal cleavage/methylation domain-containing protein